MADRSVRVGAYARISEDRDGQQTATARQMQDAREFAARREWEIVDLFEDVDLSAYNTRVKRPEFERMLEALGSREIDGVLVWKLDRLTRQQRDFARVMEVCERTGAFVASVSEPIDTRESYGQFVAELLVAQARMESANTSARQRRKAQEQREQGLPPVNGKRCFGYDQRYRQVVEEEAAIIREARDRLFAGESLRSICIDFEARGVRSTDGNGLRPNLFRRTLLSPTLAGERALDGVRYPGKWPAIISPDESRQLALVLNRRPNSRPSSARKYLLTGYIRCGRCGGRMNAHAAAGDRRRYICTRQPGYPNCGSMSVVAEPVEALVRELLIMAVDDGKLRAQVLSTGVVEDDLVEAIRRNERSLEDLSKDFYVEHLLTREEFVVARQALNQRLDEQRTRLAQRSRSRVLGDLVASPHAMGEAWEKGSLEWRRSVVGALLDHVLIAPGEPGRKPFDPHRLTPIWRF